MKLTGKGCGEMSERKQKVSMALLMVCGALTGFGARYVVDQYRETHEGPAADDPALHGRKHTALALMEGWDGKATP
jgi:hypothetical protein